MLAAPFVAASFSALCAPVVFTPTEAKLNKISIGKSDFTEQALPLGMCSTWPVWMATPDGSSVTKLPDESDGGDWCNAATFEQLWLPTDLPAPQCRAALGCVLKDGQLRYLFPCMESTITTIGGALDGQVWHNRGLNTLPLAKTWLPFGDVPVDNLRLSAYTAPLPPPPPQQADGGEPDAEAVEAATAAAEAAEAAAALWEPVLPLTPVKEAIDALFNIIGNAPDELGVGFNYLVAPLGGSGTQLNLTPGRRVRLFLSDIDATPTSLDPEDRDSWVWNRGETDISVITDSPRGESEFQSLIHISQPTIQYSLSRMPSSA